MKKKLLILSLALYAPLTALAASEKLNPIFAGCKSDGICYIGINPGATSTSCPNTRQIRFDITLAGSPSQYSAALAAVMSYKKISTSFIADTCIDGFPVPEWLHAHN